MSADLFTIDEDSLLPPLPPKHAEPEAKYNLFSPVNPLLFFSEHEVIDTPRGQFSIYTAGIFKSVAYVFIHGAGYSALSFAEVASYFQKEAFCVAIDLRNHGNSCPGDLKFEDLVNDIQTVLETILEPETPVVLFGHSLGASLITAIHPRNCIIKALILIDASEGVATESLPEMHSFLMRKPQEYESPGELAEWLFSQRELLRKTACRIEAPGMLTSENRLICDLRKSEPFWPEWFAGMNGRFLSDNNVWKLLLVSTMGKLDRDLEIAHMSGKMAVDVVRNAVHNLHEDDPATFVEITTRFLRRVHLNDTLYDKEYNFTEGLTELERGATIEEITEFYKELEQKIE